ERWRASTSGTTKVMRAPRIRPATSGLAPPRIRSSQARRTRVRRLRNRVSRAAAPKAESHAGDSGAPRTCPSPAPPWSMPPRKHARALPAGGSAAMGAWQPALTCTLVSLPARLPLLEEGQEALPGILRAEHRQELLLKIRQRLRLRQIRRVVKRP